MYDLLIKGGHVTDPAQGISGVRDIGIVQGRITALSPNLAPGEAKRVIDAKGLIVTPGLIDLHTHVANAIMPYSVPPDDAGVYTGVTAVCDAGSTGYVNFNGFRELVIPGAQTEIMCLIHLCPVGQAVVPEICWQHINRKETIKIIQNHPHLVKGIKIRAGAGFVQNLGLEGVKAAKEIGRETGVSVTVHIGIGMKEEISNSTLDSFTRGMLDLLEKGDILAHTFTERRGAVLFPDGRSLPEFLNAVDRGIVLDVSPGTSHFSFEVMKSAIGRGILPTTLSTDVVNTNINGPVLFSLPVVMSKFLALGMSLDQVIERTTVNPARVLGEEHRRGNLELGRAADISILNLMEGEYLFSDGLAGHTLAGRALLVPRLTIKAGREIPCRPRFRNFVPGEQITYPEGT